MEELQDYLEKRPRQPLTIVFVGASYLPIFEIWHGLYMINPGPDLIVIALDELTLLNLQQRHIPFMVVDTREVPPGLAQFQVRFMSSGAIIWTSVERCARLRR